MSKILNGEGRVFGCLCGLEKQAMRESVGLPNHIIEMMTEGGNWELIVSPRFFPDKAYRVTLPDAVHPSGCTCPVCFLTRPDCDEPEPAFTETAVGEFQPVKPDPLDREIATEEYLNDSGRDDPVPEKVIDPLGNYPDMKQMRDKINEIVAWSRAVTVWINANGAV